MSKSDTRSEMRRCTTMLSTDPSYDNRTIASTLKMQIWTVQRAQGDENKVPGYGYSLWCGFKWGTRHANSHLRGRLESQHQSVPGYAEECGDPLVQSGGRWQTLGVEAGLGAGPQVQRDPGLASGVLHNITSHNTNASLTAGICRVFAELPPALMEKACSQFRIRIEAGIEAEGGYIEYISFLLHNQVTWIDFFNKSFKIKL